MRRIKVVYRPEAVDDLEDIYRFVRDMSRAPNIARAFVQRLRDRCRRIGDVPLGGTPRDDLAEGIRTVPFERRAVVAYRVTANAVEITNIFYGGRDFEALYRNEPRDAIATSQETNRLRPDVGAPSCHANHDERVSIRRFLIFLSHSPIMPTGCSVGMRDRAGPRRNL